MTSTTRLSPHDPIPDHARMVLVLRRFAEDEPRTVITEIIVADGRGTPEGTPAVTPEGRAMSFEEAIAAAERQAEAGGYDRVYAVDRTAGPREREVLEAGGDHTVHMEQLDDTDLEEGERGPDMRG